MYKIRGICGEKRCKIIILENGNLNLLGIISSKRCLWSYIPSKTLPTDYVGFFPRKVYSPTLDLTC